MAGHLYADGRLAGKGGHNVSSRHMLTARKQAAQNRAAARLAEIVAHEVFESHKPADRVVANYFRQHRYLGSRDRRQLAEAVFAMFRWWGWLTATGWPERLAEAAALEQSPPADADWSKLLPAWVTPAIRCPRPLEELIRWLQRRPPLWLRVQRADPAAVIEALRGAGITAAAHEELPNALCVHQQVGNLFLLPVYQAGQVEIQDLASQRIGAVCAARPGEQWWDACAGGGGKTLLLAETAGRVLATDIREKALAELRRRADRGKFTNITTRVWDGSAAPGEFDGVLVDAPCTGSGTWRRNPAARWSLTPEDLDTATRRQARLLRVAATGVKPGGVLVYATCSLFDRENRQVVDEFLRERPEFQLERGVEIWPWDGDCDAMFAARLIRT